LSHPAQDLILDLVNDHGINASDIEAIDVGTNSNVPNALIYPMPTTALERALALAASMASGLRENFGTMTKPLHAGRSAENGVTAAQLAKRGFTSAKGILEAKRGLFNAMAGGFDETKIAGRLGHPYFMQEPGISIKPYPSGSLSHPAQDLILDLVNDHGINASDIEAIDVGTNSNVPNALIYPMPTTALEYGDRGTRAKGRHRSVPRSKGTGTQSRGDDETGHTLCG